MKTFKLKSAAVLGVLAFIASLGATTIQTKQPRIVERLALVQVDSAGHRQYVGAVKQITNSSDIAFAQKLRLARILAGNKVERPGWLAKVENFLASPAYALIPNAGETALRDCFGGTGTPSCTTVQNFKFHALGTGATAAAEGDTGLQTELSTAYNPDSTRATGSQTNNGANIYRTVGTNTVDASAAVTEWGLMSQAATGGGTLWSRIVFSAINLANGDSLQTTYDLTIE